MRIWRTLNTHGYKPYKIHISQTLRPGDSERRLEFCNWLSFKLNEDDNFLNKVIWTDECNFTTNGLFNRHNEHYWSVENPRQNQEVRPQGRLSFNVWVGMWNNKIIGPFIYEGNLNSRRYLDLINNNILDALDLEPLETLRHLWWQQDGAPPHNGREVTELLNEIFPNKWIGNRGFIRWPARSPDLNPLDYFLWGYLQNRLYRNTPRDINVLRGNLIREVRAIPARVIHRAIFKLRRLTQKCIREEGHLFEHLI